MARLTDKERELLIDIDDQLANIADALHEYDIAERDGDYDRLEQAADDLQDAKELLNVAKSKLAALRAKQAPYRNGPVKVIKRKE